MVLIPVLQHSQGLIVLTFKSMVLFETLKTMIPQVFTRRIITQENWRDPLMLVTNSHGESQSIGFGGAYKMESGYALGSVTQTMNNDYGVPGEHAESDTLIEMERDRFEFRTEVEITDSEWLRAVELNLGYADYKHSESGYETEDNVTEWHTHSTYSQGGV